jgi:hypothetical protein
MSITIRRGLAALALTGLCRVAAAQTTPAAAPPPADEPKVTFGTQTFLQYAADLHEADGYNAFDITRGYLDIRATISPRVRFRFTPDARPTTDANLQSSLALHLAYASLQVDVSPHATVLVGMHETPWLTFEQSIDRYRAQAPMVVERRQLVPGETDLGASVRGSYGPAEVHVGIYNGEGYGRPEFDKYKSLQGRLTVRPFGADGAIGGLRLSGFYSHGWYAQDRPRRLALAMASYEGTYGVVTAQVLQATDNPFVSSDLSRRGVSVFGEVRRGPLGFAGFGRLETFDPDADRDGDTERRLTIGAAHWSRAGRGRFGVMASYEELVRTIDAQTVQRRLLAQTHVEF